MAKKNRKSKELPLHWRGSFNEYLEWAKHDPMGRLRTARQYLYDAILSFGTETVPIEETDEELTRYNLFTAELPHRKEIPVHGMDRSLEMLMRHLESRAVRMHDLPRMIVLNGPPGSSKSSIVERLKVALEEYSVTDKGACFTTTVLLPNNDDAPKKKGRIGFLPEEEEKGVNGSYAHLDKDKIYAQITCPQHDSPLLWYPREVRMEKLEELLAEAGISVDEVEIPDEMLYGELCPVCSQIQDHLMAEHDDDLDEVLKYVRIDRVRFKGDVAGLATVAPGTSHNLTALSLTQDPNYQKFTNRFPGIKLVELDGAFLKANRGLIHLEDFVKAREDLNYLLRAISNGQLTTKDLRTGKEITVTVDEIILSTDNVDEIDALRQRGSKGLDSRVFVIGWPYVLEASEEEKIYTADFAESGCSDFKCVREELPHLAPHVKGLAALFAVMTRYNKPDTDNYKHLEDFSDDLKKLINSLTPFDKVQLYEGKVPERFTKEEARLLTKPVWRAIRTEYLDEGLIGVGVRDMQEVVNLLEPDEDCSCIRPTDLFDVFDEFIKTDSFHYINTNGGFISDEIKRVLPRGPTTGYHDVDECLGYARWKYDLTVSREVRQAMTNISPETMYGWIKEYVGLVTVSYDPKFLEGPEGDGSKDDDEVEEKLKEFEVLLDLKDRYSKNKFRNEVRARVARYTGQLETLEGYKRVFPELYKAVEDDRFEKVRDRFFIEDVVKPEFLEAVSKFDPAKSASALPDDMRKDLMRIFDNMHSFGYCTECTRHTLIYALDNELV